MIDTTVKKKIPSSFSFALANAHAHRVGADNWKGEQIDRPCAALLRSLYCMSIPSACNRRPLQSPRNRERDETRQDEMLGPKKSQQHGTSALRQQRHHRLGKCPRDVVCWFDPCPGPKPASRRQQALKTGELAAGERTNLIDELTTVTTHLTQGGLSLSRASCW